MELIDSLISSVNKIVKDDDMAHRVVRQLTRDFGGDQFYMPKERSAFRDDIESDICEAFDGCNAKALARRHGLTTRTIYRIIEQQRSRRAKEREDAARAAQGDLFDGL